MGAFAGCILGECNGRCILQEVTSMVRNVTFIREMNEPVMVIQTTLFTNNYNYRVVHVLTLFPQSIVHIY